MPDGGNEEPENDRCKSDQWIEGFPVVFGCWVHRIIISFSCTRETGYRVRPVIY